MSRSRMFFLSTVLVVALFHLVLGQNCSEHCKACGGPEKDQCLQCHTGFILYDNLCAGKMINRVYSTLDSPHAPFHSEVHFFYADRYWWMWYWSGSVSRQHVLLEHPWLLWMQRSVGFTHFIINTHRLIRVTLLITLFSFILFIVLLFLQDVIRPVLAVWVEELPAVRNVLLVSDHQAWDA